MIFPNQLPKGLKRFLTPLYLQFKLNPTPLATVAVLSIVTISLFRILKWTPTLQTLNPKAEALQIRSYDGSHLVSKRWSQIEENIQHEFLIDEDMIVYDTFINQGGKTGDGNIPLQLRSYVQMDGESRVWEKEGIDLMIRLNQKRSFQETSPPHYPGSSERLWYALNQHLTKNSATQIAVIGSISPWVESLILSFGLPSVDTVDYNIPISLDERINVKPIDEIKQDENKYDFLVSYSSIEHDGLGRYGDPISPKGDRAAMIEMWSMLKKDGILFLNVPYNNFDVLVYNQHRVYGPKRLQMITEGLFEPIEAFVHHEGISMDNFFEKKEENNPREPVFILRKL